jgi:hypothetical protein
MCFALACRSKWTLLWAALAAQGLAGCAEQQSVEDKAGGTQDHPVRRSDISPSGATVSIAIDGAPGATNARLIAAIATAAAQREIVVTDDKNAKYLARGYVSAYPIDGGVAIAYVWDVFDSSRRRALRMNDFVTIKLSNQERVAQERGAQEPWAVADDNALTGIAGRSVDDLAAFLSTTPEAGAASSKGIQVSKSLTLRSEQKIVGQAVSVRPAETAGMMPVQ